jgi:hypothetical protein
MQRARRSILRLWATVINLGLVSVLLCQTVVADTGKSQGNIRYGSGAEIILQGFHWNSTRISVSWYDTLEQMAPDIAADGFTAIWMPPPWRDDSHWKDEKMGVSGGGRLFLA